MKCMAFILVLGLLALGSVKSQDGGCPATGMQPYDYAQALCMSGLFYEAQRSGVLPADQRVTWRGDSAVNDGSDVGVDLSGGYYDAGDFVKFGFPGAYAVTALAWGLIAFPNGYSKAGETAHAQATVRWGAEYILKAASQGPNKFYGQVGDGNTDHAYWGRPEEMTMARPSFAIDSSNPGTDLAAESAAALAATSIVFASVDPSFSQNCLSRAKELFAFAEDFRGIYSTSISNAGSFYASYSYEDELAWGALWMYKATNDAQYLTKANGYIDEFGIMYYAKNMDWDAKQPGIYALAVELDGRDTYVTALTTYINDMINTQQKTPQGMLYFDQWGTLREAVNVAFVLMRASQLNINYDQAAVRDFALSQLDYALGSTGRSYVVGFGVNPPQRPHHRSASCPDPPATCDNNNLNSPDPNPHVLYGALVGGPDQNDQYTDDRNDYIHNEVAIDYNALFTGLLAASVELH